MISLDVPCGHFALGTLSETCLKDAGFDVNVKPKKILNLAKSRNAKIDMAIKKRIIIRYCFVSIITFQHVLIYIPFDIIYFKKNPRRYSKKGSLEYI